MNRRRILFPIFAAGFAAGALYHAVGIVAPAWTEPAPAWRHALFIAINLVVAAGLLARPRFFLWPFAALVAQQIYGHATYGWRVLREEGRVDWASVVVVVAMPTLLVLLVRDRARR